MQHAVLIALANGWLMDGEAGVKKKAVGVIIIQMIAQMLSSLEKTAHGLGEALLILVIN